jgi:hypothetical protein
MIGRVLRLAALVAAIGATMLVGAIASAKAGTPATVSVVPWNGPLLFNPCTGHLINLSGERRFVERTVFENAVEHSIFSSVAAGIRAVDTVTGETYIWNHHTSLEFYWDLGVPSTQTSEVNAVLVGGSGSFRLTGMLRYTITATGDLRASFFHFDILCR